MNKLQTLFMPTKEKTKYSIKWGFNTIFDNAKMVERYAFTPEELRQLLSDVFDAAYESGNAEALFWNTDTMTRSEYEEKAIDKKEYIENLLNKEK